MSLVPSAVIATTEGVVLIPSAFSITLGAAPSIIATHELVVPRSIPIMDSPDLNSNTKTILVNIYYPFITNSFMNKSTNSINKSASR